ncbi:MAG: carbohydrate binding family 9 domain-containing protein [Candidatus Aminicenantes bacterium]|nr:MAG: carbohydrate binding family 9 domain-containing protein [Candidatus Aminicenantes bacterium]
MKFFYLNVLMVIFAAVFNGSSFLLKAEDNQKKRQYPPTGHYQVNPAASGIKIDGVLDEEAWQKAVKIDLPYEWSPGDNTPAPVKTECMVTFNKSELHIAFRCFDPEPGKIRAHYMNRDTIDTFIQDDHICIMIDTFNDEHRAFQFRVNPLGVQVDAINSPMEDYEDFSWDAIWKSQGKITDLGYNVEIAIPFNQLRFPKSQGKQIWGFEAERSYPRNVRHRMCSHTYDREMNCIICQFNKLIGFEGISAGRNIELSPTLTLNRTDYREDFPRGEMIAGKEKIEPGMTAKWGITPNFILNTAINPDFSHVEADAAQLEVNTRFALRYPEKRLFFLEGADFFLTPMEVIFTRTVYDPVWGIKATGKIGKNAIGFFAARDNYNNLVFPSNLRSQSASIKEQVYNGVFRYRRDVGKGSTLGFLYTGRIGDDYYNHVLGADGFFQLSKTKTLDIQFLHSLTRYQENISQQFDQEKEPFNGNGVFVQLEHLSRKIYYFAEYQDLSADFRADLGFMPRVDIRRITAGIQPIVWGKPGGWFNRMTLEIRGERITDHTNELTNQDVRLTFNYEGPLQTYFSQSFAHKKELYEGRSFTLNQFQTYFNIKPRGGMNFFISAGLGDSIDYANVRPGRSFLLNPGIQLRLGRHLDIILNHIFEKLSWQGKKIYTVNLVQGNFIYNFNIKTFIRAIVHYTYINRSVPLYISPVEPITKELFTQFLFCYKMNPQTLLFLGYSDNHSGTKGIDITRRDRTFFLKIGYALAL